MGHIHYRHWNYFIVYHVGISATLQAVDTWSTVLSQIEMLTGMDIACFEKKID